MQTIKINKNKITQEQIDLIVDYLKRGRVLAYPTDTIYGLGCDAGDIRAIEKINRIKGERGHKPFLVLVSDLEMLKKYCVVSAEQEKYLKEVWHQPHATPLAPLVRGVERCPVTVILKNRKNLPKQLAGGLDSLAVRLTKNEFLIKIIDKCGFPLVSTSLNKTGEPPLSDVKNLEKYFEHLPDLAVDVGECKNVKPSRLVDLRDVKNIKVIRE